MTRSLIRYLAALYILQGLCIVSVFAGEAGQRMARDKAEQYPFISMTDTVFSFETEFIFPDGFHRPDSAELTPFQNWVSNFPLWHRFKKVGIWKGGIYKQADEVSRVVHMPWQGPDYTDVGFPLRVVAEYLLLRDRQSDLTIVPWAGDTLNFEEWLRSKVKYTPKKAVIVVPDTVRETTLNEYYRFLVTGMQNTDYRSLAANADTISAAELRPGDLLIAHDSTGRSGAAYMVMCMLVDSAGRRVYTVATGCPEPCDFHIPLLTEDRQNPWLSAEKLADLVSTYPHRGFFRLHLTKTK